MPFVSIVIPCRNEEAFIASCLESVLASDYPQDRLEVLVVDGRSDDGTRDVIGRIAAAAPVIRLLDNPDRIVPAALNIGIRAAKGDAIVRLDAHARYPSDYVPKLVDWLERSGADNVGGVCRTRPADATRKAKAIAIGLSHPFGVGNAWFRIGAPEPRWVDTVPFGCYRRAVFERIGLFDEDLVRNQDDEFNSRLVRSGGRILLVPEIVSEYFARDTLGKLWRMYYQYGYFKPLAARKVGAVMTVRQLVPGALVAAIAMSAALTIAVGRLWPVAAVLGGYGAAAAGCAAVAGWRHGLRTTLWLTGVFFVLHVSYGLGSLKGFVDFVIFSRRSGARLRATAPTR